MLLEDRVDLPGGDWDVEMGDAEVAERVYHRIDDSRRRAHGGRLADALRPERMVRRRRGRLVGLPRWRLHRGRQQVVHETALLDVAILVVSGALEQRVGHAPPHPHPTLPLYHPP